MAPAQPRYFPYLFPPADMLKDVIREYDEHFPEIIERATYTLEKVGVGMGWGQLCGTRAAGKLCTLQPLEAQSQYCLLLEALPSFSTWELPLHTSSPLSPTPWCSWGPLVS